MRESWRRLDDRICEPADDRGWHRSSRSRCDIRRSVKGLANLSLCGHWWHNFFPEAIRQVMSERLEMPTWNRQIGFFSDAYGVEWTYEEWLLLRRLLANVLAAKIELGQQDHDEEIAIAQKTLYESPQSLLRIAPAATYGRARP